MQEQTYPVPLAAELALVVAPKDEGDAMANAPTADDDDGRGNTTYTDDQ